MFFRTKAFFVWVLCFMIGLLPWICWNFSKGFVNLTLKNDIDFFSMINVIEAPGRIAERIKQISTLYLPHLFQYHGAWGGARIVYCIVALGAFGIVLFQNRDALFNIFRVKRVQAVKVEPSKEIFFIIFVIVFFCYFRMAFLEVGQSVFFDLVSVYLYFYSYCC